MTEEIPPVHNFEITKATWQNKRANWLTVFAIFVTIILVIMVVQYTNLDEFVKGIITLVIGRFLGYIDQIYGFEFGTTRSSQTKDTIIHNLSKDS